MIGMVLSDRLSGGQPPSLWKKTLLYVLSFGFGALVLAGTLGFVMTSVAGAILPGEKPSAAQPDTSSTDRPTGIKGGSKAKPPRGTEGADAAK